MDTESFIVGLEKCILSVKGSTHRVKCLHSNLEIINSCLMWTWRSVKLIAADEKRERSNISVPAAQDVFCYLISGVIMNKLFLLLVMSHYTKWVSICNVSKMCTKPRQLHRVRDRNSSGRSLSDNVVSAVTILRMNTRLMLPLIAAGMSSPLLYFTKCIRICIASFPYLSTRQPSGGPLMKMLGSERGVVEEWLSEFKVNRGCPLS